jgi:transposase
MKDAGSGPRGLVKVVDASFYLIDTLKSEIDAIEKELRASDADHPHLPLLLTIPGIGWVLAFTIAAEIGDITLVPSARKLDGYAGWCPRVRQSGDSTTPRAPVQAGTEISALGHARGDHARPAPPCLPRALPAQQTVPWGLALVLRH